MSIVRHHRDPLDELLEHAEATLCRLQEAGRLLDRATEEHELKVGELEETVKHLKEEQDDEGA